MKVLVASFRLILLLGMALVMSCSTSKEVRPDTAGKFDGQWNLDVESLHPNGKAALKSGCGISRTSLFMIVSEDVAIVRFGRNRGEGEILPDGKFSIKIATDKVYKTNNRHEFIFEGRLSYAGSLGRLLPVSDTSNERCDALVKIESNNSLENIFDPGNSVTSKVIGDWRSIGIQPNNETVSYTHLTLPTICSV